VVITSIENLICFHLIFLSTAGIGVISLWEFFLAISTGVLWGITPALYSEAAHHNSTVHANAWKSWGAFIVNWIIAISFGFFEVPDQRTFLIIALNTLTGPVIGDYAFFKGIALSGPGKATSVGFTYILWASMISIAFMGEPLSFGVISGALLSVLGIWLLTTEGGKWSLLGILWSLTASLFWAVSPSIMRLALSEINPISASTWNSLLMTLVFTPLAARRGNLKGRGRSKAVLGGGIGIGIGLPIFYYSVDMLGVSLPVLATAVSPLIAQVASWLEGEAPSLKTILGSGAIALGMAMAVL